MKLNGLGIGNAGDFVVVFLAGEPRNATVLSELAVQEGEKTDSMVRVEKNVITLMTLKVGNPGVVQDIGDSDYQQYPGEECGSVLMESGICECLGVRKMALCILQC